MKFIRIILSLFIISCSSSIKKAEINIPAVVVSQKKIDENLITSEFIFEKKQDSLRTLLLNAKPNERLKSSILQELYIRGLVNQENDTLKFKLVFNLHSFDCGAPDCYSTDLTFEFVAKETIEFPQTINFTLKEHGCGIEHEKVEYGQFELVEESPQYVNYYAKKQQSNLVILGDKRELYYFPDTKPNAIKVSLIGKIIEEYNDDDPNAIVTFQSTIMRTQEYEHFIKSE